jgi:hypothetical protein
MRDFMILVVAALACAALFASNALDVTLAVSLTQAAADVALAFVVFMAWRVPVVLLRERAFARERRERDAAAAEKWREHELAQYEAERATRRRRRSRA